MSTANYSSDVRERALRIHHSSTVCDLHADTFIAVRYVGCNLGKRHTPPRFWNPLRKHCDLPRLKEGGVSVQGFGVVIPPWVRGQGRFQHAHGTIRLMHRTFQRFGAQVGLARTPSEAEVLQAQGRLAGMIGIEGAQALAGRPERVDLFREMGVSYLGLCHFGSTDVVISSAARRPSYQGLGPIGRETIQRCNRSGILVDLAHCHEVSFFEALQTSVAPVVVTHGAARALSDHHRNVSDEQLRAIAATGGVVGIIFFPWFLSTFGVFDDYRRIVDHIDHIAQTVGPEYVALGSDFDGYVWTTRGMRDVTDLPLLTCELVKRGYEEEAIRGILGGNFMRAWQGAIDVAERLSS